MTGTRAGRGRRLPGRCADGEGSSVPRSLPGRGARRPAHRNLRPRPDAGGKGRGGPGPGSGRPASSLVSFRGHRCAAGPWLRPRRPSGRGSRLPGVGRGRTGCVSAPLGWNLQRPRVDFHSETRRRSTRGTSRAGAGTGRGWDGARGAPGRRPRGAVPSPRLSRVGEGQTSGPSQPPGSPQTSETRPFLGPSKTEAR